MLKLCNSYNNKNIKGAQQKMNSATDFIIEHGVLRKYVGKGGEVVVPNDISSIGRNAFFGCENLTSITIPNSVTSIEGWAFSGCKNLKNINLSDSLTLIGISAFYGCKKLTSLKLPDSITSIGKKSSLLLLFLCF